MPRRLFTLLSATSLLLCGATLFFWASGYMLGWQFECRRTHWDGLGRSRYRLLVEGGGIRLENVGYTVPATLPPYELTEKLEAWQQQRTLELERTVSSDYPTTHKKRKAELPVLGLVVWWESEANVLRDMETAYARGVILPCWPVVLLTASVPTTWWFHFRRRKSRRADRLCLACGYDLRATPERCPECGAVPAKTLIPN